MATRYRAELRSVPLFADCSEHELEAISRASFSHDVGVGDVLAREGRREEEFYLIVSGTADVARAGRSVATLKAGDCFGELALLANTQRNATVTVTAPARVLEIQSREFLALLDDVPALRVKLLRGLASRLRRTDSAA